MDKILKKKLLDTLKKTISYMSIEEVKVVLAHDYHGQYANKLEFTKALICQAHLVRELKDIPDYLADYIDWQRMTKDLFKSDYYSIKLDGEKGIFVFNRIDF